MTGSDETDASFDGVLTKPFDERTLTETVAKALVAHGTNAGG
jgi:hypothetical protein